jgi:hypothetical protein
MSYSSEQTHNFTGSVVEDNYSTCLNNTAVAAMLGGNYALAIETLSCACKVSKRRLSLFSSKASLPKNIVLPKGRNVMASSSPQTRFRAVCRFSKCDAQVSAVPDLDSYFCARPLQLLPATCRPRDDPNKKHSRSENTTTPSTLLGADEKTQEGAIAYEDAKVCAYAIIYNVALCHHLQAIVMTRMAQLTPGIGQQAKQQRQRDWAYVATNYPTRLTTTSRQHTQKLLTKSILLYSSARKLLAAMTSTQLDPTRNHHATSTTIQQLQAVLLSNMVHANQLVGKNVPAARQGLAILAKCLG